MSGKSKKSQKNHAEQVPLEVSLKMLVVRKGENDETKIDLMQLEQILFKYKLTPVFDELPATKNSTNHNVYGISLSLAGREIQQYDVNKRLAKQRCAQLLVQSLIHNPLTPEDYENASNEAGNATRYAIRDLQDLCNKNKMRIPKFDVAEVQFENGMFTAICEVEGIREEGTGVTKMIAKREAAFKVLKKLESHVTVPEVNEITENEDDGMPDFNSKLKNIKGKFLDELDKMDLSDPKLNSFNFLEDIAKDLKCGITYFDDITTSSGKSACMIMLSTKSPIVVGGSGKNMNEAKSDATYKALKNINILRKSANIF